ncbi:hypothetical protein [Streptomyces sp. NPDC001091]
MARDENMIAALKRERANYVAAGDEDRVDQVDASLRHYGYEPGQREEDGPQGRTGVPPQQTADQGGQAQEPTGQSAAKKTPAKKTTTAPQPTVPPAQ